MHTGHSGILKVFETLCQKRGGGKDQKQSLLYTMVIKYKFKDSLAFEWYLERRIGFKHFKMRQRAFQAEKLALAITQGHILRVQNIEIYQVLFFSFGIYKKTMRLKMPVWGSHLWYLRIIDSCVPTEQKKEEICWCFSAAYTFLWSGVNIVSAHLNTSR